MYKNCDTVVDGSTVYVMKSGTVNIYSYDVTSDSWSQLPDCVHRNGSITVINGCLTTVGGGSYHNYSNELFSITGEGSGRRWTQQFRPMPTKRRLTTSLCTGTALIVAGGRGECEVLSIVEVMDIETHQWSATASVADLPQPMYRASATIFGDQLYMLGGFSKDFHSITSMYTCAVNTLLCSCVKHPQQKRAPPAYKDSVWKQLADLPVTQSTCESFHGRLLVIGGKIDSGKSTTAVHMYNSTANSWEIVSRMKCGRRDCFTAVLPDNRLMVVGGETDGGSLTDVVELASVSMC
jgi:N-acetylneuraminic acid mutarotase